MESDSSRSLFDASALLQLVRRNVFQLGRWFATSRSTRALRISLLLLAGGILTALVVTIYVLNDRTDLSPWHTVILEEEFTKRNAGESFADYLAREDRLFAEMEERILLPQVDEGPPGIHRFRKGSITDPTSRAKNWNRTFELMPEGGDPRCGVLMLHGMSDSPYSLRAVGESLQKRGAYVIGLRLPGHGTIPSGLLELTRHDLKAAVVLAMKHLREQAGDRPLYLVGYSSGGALATVYALDSLQDESLPKVEGVVLISPAIGVSRIAALAVWQGRLGHWLGLDKLAWNSIGTEYDPYKYNSFTVNAGDQVYRLTAEIGRRFDRLKNRDELRSFPTVLAFQSAVDATVSTPDLIEGLFSKLSEGRHELVLFDLNRIGLVEEFLVHDPEEELTDLVVATGKHFSLTVLANRSESDLALEERHYPPGDSTVVVSDPGLSWPSGIYSLSHVALPFPPSDPLYGFAENGFPDETHFQIGNLHFRGERGILSLPPESQLRLRSNPFYEWLEKRILAFVLTEDS